MCDLIKLNESIVKKKKKIETLFIIVASSYTNLTITTGSETTSPILMQFQQTKAESWMQA